MSAIGPLGRVLAKQSEVSFMDQGGRLKGVARSLRSHLLLGEPPEFVVDQRPQPILSPGVAAAHGGEKLGNGASSWRRHG